MKKLYQTVLFTKSILIEGTKMLCRELREVITIEKKN